MKTLGKNKVVQHWRMSVVRTCRPLCTEQGVSTHVRGRVRGGLYRNILWVPGVSGVSAACCKKKQNNRMSCSSEGTGDKLAGEEEKKEKNRTREVKSKCSTGKSTCLAWGRGIKSTIQVGIAEVVFVVARKMCLRLILCGQWWCTCQVHYCRLGYCTWTR